MDRETAKQEVLRRVKCTDYLEKSKDGMYCCPFCGSGYGEHGTGAVKYYAGTNTVSCFARCGIDMPNGAKKYDVLDLIQKVCGCDYNSALKQAAESIGISIDDAGGRTYPTPAQAAQKPARSPQNGKTRAGGANIQPGAGDPQTGAQGPTETAAADADYLEYYAVCMERLNDPEALAYLAARGISEETAARTYIGYDPAADPANAPGAMGDEYKPFPAKRIIAPTSKSHYVGRRIDGLEAVKKANSKGSSAGIFNEAALYDRENRFVFVVEGFFDALSVIEVGAAAVALNSANNGNKLIRLLEQKPTAATLILCLDNDGAGTKVTPKLAAGLKRLNVRFITADICGGHKDANEALVADREAFEKAVQAAQAAAKEAGAPADPGEVKTEMTDREETAAANEPAEGGTDKPAAQDEKAVNGAQPAQPAGLLTLERAVKILESEDEHYLTMRRFPRLSAMLKIRTHESIVIAADTGTGKSSLALNFLHELQDRYPCLYINLEMDEATILQRLVAIHTGMELDRIEGYKHDQNTREAVNMAIKQIVARQPLQLLTDEEAYSLQKIEEHIKAATNGRTEPTIVFIDTALLVKINKSVSRYERFTEISEELRRIARLNNVVMFLLLQQSRDGKREEANPPTNSSLKESGSWENDASRIVFLWDNPRTRKKELHITKNRKGERGIIELRDDPRTQTYNEEREKIPFDDKDSKEPKNITARF